MTEKDQSPQPEKLSQYWVSEGPNPIAEKGIRGWVEEQIQEAMSQGKFDDLPGRGKPLKLGSVHPWEEKDWMVNHILSNASVLPEWMELDRQIKEELVWLKRNPAPHPERAQRIADLNRLIDRFNFVVPLGSMQRPRVRE